MTTPTTPSTNPSASHPWGRLGVAIDPADDRYFISSNDTSGFSLIPDDEKLTGAGNYHNWVQDFTEVLLIKNKLWVIDGSSPKSSIPVEMHYRWERCSVVVKSWIIASISCDLTQGLRYIPSAIALWTELKERFSTGDSTLEYHLVREIYTTQQGTLSIAKYFQKLKILWDELAVIDENWMCHDCSASSVGLAKKDKQKLIQFLIGLNDTFSGVRSNLLMMKPLPSLNYAYSVLSQEESQRLISSGSFGGQSSVTLGEITPYSGPGQGPGAAMYSAKGNFQGNGNDNGSSSRPNFSRNKKEVITCSYCGKMGHTIVRCWSKNGIPPQILKRFKANAVAAGLLSADGTEPQSSSSSSSPSYNSGTSSHNAASPIQGSPLSSPASANQAMTGPLQWGDGGSW